MKNFLIAGGGTAGWITATLLKSIYPDCNITVLDSSKINTIGVGESTTPAILDFLNIANINFSDFINKTDSTIKVGINFENWSALNKSYLHSFELLKDKELQNISWGVDYLQDFKDNKHSYSELVDKNLVPITNAGNPVGTHALHINAHKLVEYLKTLLKDKIKIKDALITRVIVGEQGVEKLILDTGDEETADVFFDCTGFNKVIHKEVASSWKSLKELLPVDRAIPCPIDWTNPMNTTHASALTSGWAWQVPLQTRIGTGYVYSSSFAKNPEDEFAEFILKKYGKTIDIGRTIKFESGYVTNPWNKNVVCIGLSSGFLEPLESTSIHMIQHQVLGFTQMYDGVITKKIASLYNSYMCDMYEDAAAFIKLHYLVTPHNNEFWNYMNSSVGHPRLESLLEIWKTHLPSADHIGQNKNSTVGYRIFAIAAWLQVMQGVGKLTKTSIKQFMTFNQLPKFEKDFSNLLTQREFLSLIVKK